MKRIIILATGGTIAGIGEPGKTTGYVPGSLDASEIVGGLPGLKICSINSDDITAPIWIRMARVINEMAADADGFVVMHGTDTMEETAYFLHLTVKTDKPVVLTGAMKPASSISADGPGNLYQALRAAASDCLKGLGVTVVFSGRIYSARYVTKKSTYDNGAIDAGEMGALGIIRDEEILIYNRPAGRHTIETDFDVSGAGDLPKVFISYFYAESDAGILAYAAAKSEGIVIAGAGAGEYSMAFKQVIERLDIPVVISSRINFGPVTKGSLLLPDTIAAGNLTPQKAAVLLRLALMTTKDKAKIREYFEEY